MDFNVHTSTNILFMITNIFSKKLEVFYVGLPFLYVPSQELSLMAIFLACPSELHHTLSCPEGISALLDMCYNITWLLVSISVLVF